MSEYQFVAERLRSGIRDLQSPDPLLLSIATERQISIVREVRSGNSSQWHSPKDPDRPWLGEFRALPGHRPLRPGTQPPLLRTLTICLGSRDSASKFSLKDQASTVSCHMSSRRLHGDRDAISTSSLSLSRDDILRGSDSSIVAPKLELERQAY